MGIPDLSLALSTKSTSEDISAACTAASGFKIVVKLSNASASSHQAYKCKTNAPRRWSVRPNGGVIAPGEEIEVVFKLCGSTMQGLAQDRHLILTAPVAADEARRLLKQRAERPRSSPEAPDLETNILEAILSDCDTTEDAIMHAVKWSEPEIIDNQLQISRQIDAEGLVRAFQSALFQGAKTGSKVAAMVVATLIDYNADARLTRFNRLFGGAPASLGALLGGAGLLLLGTIAALGARVLWLSRGNRPPGLRADEGDDLALLLLACGLRGRRGWPRVGLRGLRGHCGLHLGDGLLLRLGLDLGLGLRGRGIGRVHIGRGGAGLLVRGGLGRGLLCAPLLCFLRLDPLPQRLLLLEQLLAQLLLRLGGLFVQRAQLGRQIRKLV